ncbi:hypothetical protein BABINDRAFT_159911 [Babjeviella inositovora NRRL Y-12698]|uniref:Uncharacterized protein n=1 Tax=Babjeviella inositovora NRRL Y-12698 TaxID=984486 RepID=A0A1E3QVG6_9ASCO|nr:uncharacterized protein BABINDRAFT_159911 [Babjeviella inositovora NRRL Y-12698]ODQ81649.1 hypothetical protein BABINDRAFT_159911 [Babjeviella inositovora NRRL Y-12698]
MLNIAYSQTACYGSTHHIIRATLGTFPEIPKELSHLEFLLSNTPVCVAFDLMAHYLRDFPLV